jgi:tetratricopeptide (TPR) repeat protein
MAKKLSRQELKRDEILDSVGKGVRYVSSHRKGAVEAVAAVAALGILIGGFLAFRAYREKQAAEHLSRALAVLSTPLQSQAPAGTSVTFATDAQREAAAEKELRAAAELATTPAGREARVLLAARGATGIDAVATFDHFARGADSVLAVTAEIDAARLLAGQGKTDEAIERLKRAVGSAKSSLPKDALLDELGRLYEQAGHTADARATYQRLLSEHPDSPFAADAQARLAAL